MRIHDLPIPHLSQMSNEEQLTLILSVRERRRQVPERVQRAKAAKTKLPKAMTLVSKLTKEQLMQVYEALVAQQPKETSS